MTVEARNGTHVLTWVQKTTLNCARLYLFAAHPVLIYRFFRNLNYWPDPAVPRRYNEKLLWRKLVDRNPLFVELTDKLAAKRIARARCPSLGVAKVVWAGTEPLSLPASLLAQDVAVKANHSSGSNVFVTGGKPEYARIVSRAERWLQRRHERRHGEWAYGDVLPILYVEEKLQLGGEGLPTDVKVHTFADGIGHVWVTDKSGGRSRTYDAEGAPVPIRDTTYPAEDQELPDSPAIRALVRHAVELAPRLLGRLDYARIDFMVAGGVLYFGEYTLYPAGGYDHWLSSALMERAATLWDLRCSHFLRAAHRGFLRRYAEALREAIDTE